MAARFIIACFRSEVYSELITIDKARKTRITPKINGQLCDERKTYGSRTKRSNGATGEKYVKREQNDPCGRGLEQPQ